MGCLTLVLTFVLHPKKYYALPQCQWPPLQRVNTQISVTNGNQVVPMDQVVLPLDIDGVDILNPWYFEQHDCIINFGRNTLEISGKAVSCSLESKLSSVFRIRVKQNTSMPPRSKVIVPPISGQERVKCYHLNSCWKGTLP